MKNDYSTGGDNRIFNINGGGEAMLLDTLKLVFRQEGENTTAKGWIKDPDKGMILLWWSDGNNPDYHPFPSELNAIQILPVIVAYLESEEADKVTKEKWEEQYGDSDVTCNKGWRVYCEDWGHVKSISSAICAIKLVYLWYGK
jgi:hypothetical protein